MVSRRITVKLVEEGRFLEGSMAYTTVGADGSESVEDCPFRAPVLREEDYPVLFDRAGLSAEAFVDYSTRPDDGSGKLLCYVCVRRR